MYLQTFAPNENSNQPACPHCLISLPCMHKELCILVYPKCTVNAQADLNLCWANMSEGMFYGVAAPIYGPQAPVGNPSRRRQLQTKTYISGFACSSEVKSVSVAARKKSFLRFKRRYSSMLCVVEHEEHKALKKSCIRA